MRVARKSPPRCFRNVEELLESIGEFVDNHNRQPRPFIWTAKASDIPEKVKRARAALAGEAFLRALRDFYRDSKFEAFYTAQQGFYRLAEARFAATLRNVDFSWYPRFYGLAPGLGYHVILGMNNGGGNYGPHLDLGKGRSELFSIIGCWTHMPRAIRRIQPTKDTCRLSSTNSTTRL